MSAVKFARSAASRPRCSSLTVARLPLASAVAILCRRFQNLAFQIGIHPMRVSRVFNSVQKRFNEVLQELYKRKQAKRARKMHGSAALDDGASDRPAVSPLAAAAAAAASAAGSGAAAAADSIVSSSQSDSSVLSVSHVADAAPHASSRSAAVAALSDGHAARGGERR